MSVKPSAEWGQTAAPVFAVTILGESLAKALAAVAPAITKRPALAIWGSVLLHTKDGRVIVTATNLDAV